MIETKLEKIENHVVKKKVLLYGANNLLINGSFDFWQRGQEFFNLQENSYCADGWYIYSTGGVTTAQVIMRDGERSEYSLNLSYESTQGPVILAQKLPRKIVNFTKNNLVSFLIRAKSREKAKAKMAFSIMPGVFVKEKEIDLSEEFRTFSITMRMQSNFDDLDVCIFAKNAIGNADICIDDALLVLGDYDDFAYYVDGHYDQRELQWYLTGEYVFEEVVPLVDAEIFFLRYVPFPVRMLGLPTINLLNCNQNATAIVENVTVDGFYLRITRHLNENIIKVAGNYVADASL